MSFRLMIRVAVICCLYIPSRSQNLNDDDDYGGVLTQQDFDNADKEEFSREAVGAEMNEDSENLFEGDIILENVDAGHLADVTTRIDAKWPKVDDTVTIPYTFSSDATEEQRADIAHVINEFQRKTCIRFKKRENELDWIHLKLMTIICSSHVGRKGGQQKINAGGCLDARTGGSWGKLLHEVMHAIGFVHEHTRTDRDRFVTIHWDQFNISYNEDYPSARNYNRTAKNYWICTNCKSIGQYDHESVMHYPSTMGTQNRTVLTANEGTCENCELGQRRGLSEQDVEDIHKLYDCRLTYDEYKDRCDAKIDDLRPAEEERVRGEEKVKYCQYIDCTTIQATKLCPEECSKKNSSGSGIWHHNFDVGKDIIITHSAETPPIYCKFETDFLLNYLYLTRPAHPRYGDNLSEENGRIRLDYTLGKACQVSVRNLNVEDSGQWKFTVESKINGTANVKTFLHNVNIRPNDKQMGNWINNGTCEPLFQNERCGPGYQMMTRKCVDGGIQKCALSDVMKIYPCHEHDCPKSIGEWENIGKCEAAEEDGNGKCGDGNQRQRRICQEGTKDKCTGVNLERIISCSDAGTAYPVCNAQKQLSNWVTEGPCKPLYQGKPCGPGIQSETRNCIDGATEKCTLSDKVRFKPCHDHDCDKMVGEWQNAGACEALDNDGYGGCGDGNQVQTRSCQPGTSDSCTNEETVRIISCNEAGTAYPCLPDHCRNYFNISDSWRKIQSYDVYHDSNFKFSCDKYNVKMDGNNFFRFIEESGTKLQTRPNPLAMKNENPCHTTAVGWLNGRHPGSQAEGIIRQKVCFAWKGNQCYGSTLYINLAKCEPSHGTHFYVYQLKQPTACNNAYCAE